MKNIRVLVLCTMWLLLLSYLSLSAYAYAEAEDGNELHLYLEIPFERATPEIVSHILLEKTSASFEVLKEAWSGTADGIVHFGYEWNLQLDFNDNYLDINRILLSSAQSARVVPEEFYERLRSDLLQFIDVEGQLTDLYGEPDYCFFFTESRRNIYMFQSGIWDIEQMMAVCKEYGIFHLFSIWGNVVLQTWSDSQDFRYADKPLSRVMLYYYPYIMPPPDSSIIQFPPSQGS